MAPGLRRRTAGLRREEVAALTGMSADYYARLEQQWAPQPSEQMVAAIARALRLSLDERDHLFRLAGHTAPTRVIRSDHVSPGLMRVLDRLDDTPARVVSDIAETMVQNRLATALLGDQTRFEGLARSAVYRWFTDVREREMYPETDHDLQTNVQVANLRVSATRSGPGSRAAAVATHLRQHSAEFERVWNRHDVTGRSDDTKTIVHPELGPIRLQCQILFTQDHGQALLVFTAAPGSQDYSKLQMLSVIGPSTSPANTHNPRRTGCDTPARPVRRRRLTRTHQLPAGQFWGGSSRADRAGISRRSTSPWPAVAR